MKKVLLPIHSLASAAIASFVAIWFVVDVERWAQGLTTSPYGWERIAIAHCLAALPLAWWLATLIEAKSGGTRWTSLFSIGVAILLFSATVMKGAEIGIWLDEKSAGFGTRLMFRTVWYVALQVPWLLFVSSFMKSMKCSSVGNDARIPFKNGSVIQTAKLFLALLVAFVAPMSYAITFSRLQASSAEQLMNAQRPIQASQLLQRLADIGSTSHYPFFDTRSGKKVQMSVRETLGIQQKEIARRSTRASELMTGARNHAERLELAQHLAALDAADEAIELLEPLAPDSPSAAVELGKLLQEERNWEASSRWLEHALQQLQRSPDELLEPELQSQIYAALGHNAREMKQFDQTEQYYSEALQRLPNDHAKFHGLLAVHYQDGGLMNKSNKHMQHAAELSPETYETPQMTVWLWGLLAAAVAFYLVIQDFVLT